ncbi:hypothetical protein Smic_84940 [Streptomyces microflavus]|uniref:Uncharacterized protein n=1 Tax=Streptomyces microflavus TaxID=1919 RepID=A0A7J0D5D9_STRMI|nr:hypothetical protein Smic_84940 [Streptomyces microflavus]
MAAGCVEVGGEGVVGRPQGLVQGGGKAGTVQTRVKWIPVRARSSRSRIVRWVVRRWARRTVSRVTGRAVIQAVTASQAG